MSDSFVTPWTVAHQAPLSMGFSRQEYWSGWPFPSPGDLPDPGIVPMSPVCLASQAGFYRWATVVLLQYHIYPMYVTPAIVQFHKYRDQVINIFPFVPQRSQIESLSYCSTQDPQLVYLWQGPGFIWFGIVWIIFPFYCLSPVLIFPPQALILVNLKHIFPFQLFLDVYSG